MSFKKCLVIGQSYETKSLKILEKHGFKNITIDYKYNPYYDITAYLNTNNKNNKKVYIEVKYNSLIDKTNKIFLECCKTNLNVSGLSITKSHYYIIHSNSKYWIIKTKTLKKLLNKTIKHELKKVGIHNATNEQLCSYIQYEGIKTSNTIGILIDVCDVEKKALFYGSNKQSQRLF